MTAVTSTSQGCNEEARKDPPRLSGSVRPCRHPGLGALVSRAVRVDFFQHLGRDRRELIHQVRGYECVFYHLNKGAVIPDYLSQFMRQTHINPSFEKQNVFRTPELCLLRILSQMKSPFVDWPCS